MLLTVPPMVPGLATAITPSLHTANTVHLYVSVSLVLYSNQLNDTHGAIGYQLLVRLLHGRSHIYDTVVSLPRTRNIRRKDDHSS